MVCIILAMEAMSLCPDDVRCSRDVNFADRSGRWEAADGRNIFTGTDIANPAGNLSLIIH